MSLVERYKKVNDEVLITVLEHSEDYRPECIDVVKAEIESRNLSESEIQELAKIIYRKDVLKLLDGFNPVNEQMHVPESVFLSHEEAFAIFKPEVDAWIERKGLLTFDVWKYSIVLF